VSHAGNSGSKIQQARSNNSNSKAIKSWLMVEFPFLTTGISDSIRVVRKPGRWDERFAREIVLSPPFVDIALTASHLLIRMSGLQEVVAMPPGAGDGMIPGCPPKMP
jgi:hypothetical protein